MKVTIIKELAPRIGRAIALLVLLTAHTTPAAFIIEASDEVGRLGDGNFTYTGAGGTAASYGTSSPGGLPAVSNDVPATFFTLINAYGGNGTTDEYTFTYTPLSDGDNTAFATNTLFNLPQNLRSSGISGGDAGTYNIYRIHPKTTNVSGSNTTYKVSVNGGLELTQVIDQNAADLSTGENIGRWELLGSVDLSNNTDTVTVIMTPINSTYVSMRASGIMFEYAAEPPDTTDTDEDGILDVFDNAPLHPNAPRIDINSDGGINYPDQLDNDNDGIGDPADDDDDNDGVLDTVDNAPFVPNADQADTDSDGIGDVADPFNNTDSDSDGVADGPLDPDLYAQALTAKARWSRNDTHFIIRIDALSRAFQNEFTQIMTDAAILTPGEWDTKKFESYNGIGDAPATNGYQVAADLPGGLDCPVTLAVVPRMIWNAFGDRDPVFWINNRISNPNLEISMHGAYHANNTMLGDWKDMPDRNIYSSETAGLTLEECFQLLRVGKRTLLGDYASDPWILDSGVDPATAPKISWSNAANPLISYAPPYNTADTVAREAIAQLGFSAFSASIAEEYGFLAPFFSPEGSHHEMIDQFGMYHASADRQVDPEAPEGMTYLEFLQSITQTNELNTWLIEEVEWCTRYCNDLDRLVSCSNAPGGINRENNMVDPDRWSKWITLLQYAKDTGEVMTMSDYALAMQFDNAPTVPNPNQADSDQNGIGDVIDGATLSAERVQIEAPGEATLMATLLNGTGAAISNQTVLFFIDTDGDGTEEQYAATTGTNGVATTVVSVPGGLGTVYYYRLNWNGGLIDAEGRSIVRVGPMTIINHYFTSEGHFEVTAEGFATNSTYRLMRWSDLLGVPAAVVSNFAPAGATDTLIDTNSPENKAFYRVDEE